MGPNSGSDTAALLLTARRIINVLTQVLIGIVLYHMLWFSGFHNYSNPFSWHIILCTLGYIFFMAEGILVFSKDNTWSDALSRTAHKTLHWIFLGCGSILCIAGISIEIDRKNTFKAAHFTTAHGITGLISMILVMVSLFGGLTVMYVKTILPGVRPVLIKFGHNLLGTAAFAMGIVSYILGYYTHYFSFAHAKEVQIFFVVITAVIGFLAIVNSLRNAYQQLRTIFT